MSKRNVVFLAATEYDNLGVGYIAATLNMAGIETRIVDFRKRRSYILKVIKTINPVLIGFSVIFLNYIEHFTTLAQYLRKNGINCHFTAGGHYASLKYDELFGIMPQLDSIVRFEGEYTTLELVKYLMSGDDWQTVKGLVYKINGIITANSLRPVETDLDKFPYPLRLKPRNFGFKKRFTTLIASRGCTNNCSFCTTPEFFRKSTGPVKRTRKPENVVNEIEYLYKKHNYSVFLFQDDDFPLKSKMNPDWILKFCSELKQKKLSQKIIWKINCRPDEIDEEIFLIMKRTGLFHVFIGLEDSTDIGLKKLNKHITLRENLQGLKILKKLKIGFDYGFMLFQPDTIYRSLHANLVFLKSVCANGYTPATFLRLLPLYETPVEKELIQSGRLDYSDGKQGYSFLQESMNHYYDFVMDCFDEWLHGQTGVENLSKWARYYMEVYLHFFNYQADIMKLFSKVRSTIATSNNYILDTMKELALLFESNEYKSNQGLLDNYRKNIGYNHDLFKNQIINNMGRILDIAST